MGKVHLELTVCSHRSGAVIVWPVLWSDCKCGVRKYFNQNISILCRLSSACQVLLLTLSSAGKKVSPAFLALIAEDDGGCKYISEIHQWGQTFSFPCFYLFPSHCRWSFIPSRQLSSRWWKKASRWRLDNTFLSNVQQCLNWNGIHLHWLLPQKRITSAFTSESWETGQRACSMPVAVINKNSRRHGRCPSMYKESPW